MDANELDAAGLTPATHDLLVEVVPASREISHVHARMRASQGAFLAAYASTARIDKAAEAAGISRRTHYDWLKNDAEYPAMFAETEMLAAQQLLDEATRRAFEGVEEPVTVAGEKVLVRRYSDRLMERLLEARFPVLFRSNLAHRLIDEKGKDRELIDFAALDKLIRAADERDKEPA